MGSSNVTSFIKQIKQSPILPRCGKVDLSSDNTTPVLAQRKVIGDGGNVKVRAKVLLFDYSDNDYDHLDGNDINKEEKRIENADSKRRELVG